MLLFYNIFMALITKWPIMYWSVIKKLLTHPDIQFIKRLAETCQ